MKAMLKVILREKIESRTLFLSVVLLLLFFCPFVLFLDSTYR